LVFLFLTLTSVNKPINLYYFYLCIHIFYFFIFLAGPAENDAPAFKFPLAPSACLSRFISLLFLCFGLFFFLCSVFQNTSLLSLGLFLLSLSSLLPLAFLRVLPALPWPLGYVIPLLWPYLAYKAR